MFLDDGVAAAAEGDVAAAEVEDGDRGDGLDSLAAAAGDVLGEVGGFLLVHRLRRLIGCKKLHGPGTKNIGDIFSFILWLIVTS